MFFEAVAFCANGEGAGGVAFGDEVVVEFLEGVFVGSGEAVGFCGEFSGWTFLPEPLELEAECGEAAGDGFGWVGRFFRWFFRGLLGRFVLGGVLGFVFGRIGWFVFGRFLGFFWGLIDGFWDG